ncbi:di-heme-cytochrome C peroxidase [Cellvibrio sp. OA-2007]|uniref:di-heme-cytochrome C peroxidase n=1 Tax=Cellvibrio sp. OA-2007 TaxID=529823 RepID=UPI000781D817|nr:di-heme-cytochrome C peroxidase [Cellvibrio sp. OA-2007]
MGAFNAGLCNLLSRHNLWRLTKLLIILAIPFGITLLIGKLYQSWDDDPERGAIAIENGAFGESYSTPIYLDQGWTANDSLWYYNTTQGSALMPYDFFIALEQADSKEPFRANSLIDKYRYLPQKPTFFNPDGLPVGFVKETYKGNDYIGFTCAACHTGQVNYKGTALRIDGGSSMADMVGFLTELQKSMDIALADSEKNQRFVAKVLELNNTYNNAETVQADLRRWARKIRLYNNINDSKVAYGYARLDAFGRIYNRVLEHVISRNQVRDVLLGMTKAGDAEADLLTPTQVDKVLEGISETIIGDLQFAQIIDRLMSTKDGYPGLAMSDMNRIKAEIFNEPNAPVSYPFLWDIVQSDYVQWNGLAANAGVGPLGRNTGEVIGVFGILDWTAHKRGWSLSSFITGQKSKSYQIDFTSSIDLVNLSRLETHLASLTSPVWPTLATDNAQQKIANEIFGKLPEWQIDAKKVRRGRQLYAEYCESCHEVIDRTDHDRIVVADMSSLDVVGTDRAMAENSVNYKGYSGNFKNTYQSESVGSLVIKNQAPVVQILTATTMGEVTTAPDPDKWWPRRALDWLYMLAKSFFDNEIKASVKSGNYQPDTTASPYQSLLSYKARSLNGIWATAPYLHNGSVPSIYDLLLPVKGANDPADGHYRPNEFKVGSREFDPVKVGLRTEGYEGFTFKADKRGDYNSGHEYGTANAPAVNGVKMEPLTEEERWDLVEYIKTL